MGIFDDEEIRELLSEFGLPEMPIYRTSSEDSAEINPEKSTLIRNWMDRCSIVDKLSVLCAIHPLDSCNITNMMTVRRSRTNRVVNVFSDEKHILSPRLTDGGISLSLTGARVINKLHSSPVPMFGPKHEDEIFAGIPRIHISDDAIPFVGQGRNVVHGYALGADPHLTPGLPCLIVDSRGSLVAHGTSLSTAADMEFMKKGLAVKVRDGALKETN